MKKIVLMLYLTIVPLIATAAQTRFAAINGIMAKEYTSLFGADPLHSISFTQEKASKWRTVMNLVSAYVNANDTNLFGTKDPILTEALDIIKKADESLIAALQKTPLVDNSTQQNTNQSPFSTIEQQMNTVIKELQNGSFILKSKKNARTILVNFAQNMVKIAKKAQEEHK